jgi:hypothetical protein
MNAPRVNPPAARTTNSCVSAWATVTQRPRNAAACRGVGRRAGNLELDETRGLRRHTKE